MAIEQELVQEEESMAPTGERLTDDEEQDLKIAVMMAEDMIDQGGIDIIDQAVKESSDPGQVIGQFLMQLVSQLDEMLPDHLKLSKRIYFAEGGWIEQVSDYIQEEYGISKEIMDRAEIYIGTTAQQMAGAKGQQGAPAPEGGAAPPAAPQGGAMPPLPTGGA